VRLNKVFYRDQARHARVADYLKRCDIIFVPLGAVEINGIMPSDRDYAARGLWHDDG